MVLYLKYTIMNLSQEANLIHVRDDLVFDTERFTALLSIQPAAVVFDYLQAYADELGVVIKPEFHLTVIGFVVGRQLKAIVDKLPSADHSTVIDFFVSQLGEYSWGYEFKEEFYKIEKSYQFRNQPRETRTSIIQTVEMPDLAEFYDMLSDTFEMPIEVPFTHVTLYTNSSNTANQNMGIGINSEAEFKALQPVRIE